MTRMQRQIRLAYYHDKRHTDDPEDGEGNYNPKIYLKFTWNDIPMVQRNDVEWRMMNFADELTKRSEELKKIMHKKGNLPPHLMKALRTIAEDKRFIVCLTDKNLGPAIMERAEYLRRVYEEHLSNEEAYRQLDPKLGKEEYEKALGKLKFLTLEQMDNNQFPPDEFDYFKRAFDFRKRWKFSRFYLTMKIHKTPTASRPVTDCYGTFMSIFSKWLDVKLECLVENVPSRLKDSMDLIRQLQALGYLPPGARLFTADAKAMYTNIDTAEGLAAIRNWLTTFFDELPEDFPNIEYFMSVLEIVMTESVFEFGDTLWKQVVGTAMGTPCACSYATTTYGWHERTYLIPRYKDMTMEGFICRFIDDMIGVWYDPDMPLDLSLEEEKEWFENNQRWKEFEADLPSLGLEWKLEIPTRSVDFLDLTLRIEKGSIHSRTFQKLMNLYLYIPPHSAHPASCLKGLIYGILLRYWQQNTDHDDFVTLAGLFFHRLLARGHAADTITPIFTLSAEHIDWRDANPDSVKMKKENKRAARRDTLYIHWRCHPCGVSTKEIRRLYMDHLHGHTLKDHMVVSNARARNLRDILMSNTFVCADSTDSVSAIFKRYCAA